MQQDTLPMLITLALRNFSMVMLILLIIVLLIDKASSRRRRSDSDIVFRWTAFFMLGVTGLYAFTLHAGFPAMAAINIGWLPSPFQFEVALADLALGVLGIACFSASYGFRLATVVASICMLWGDAAGHIYQIVVAHNNAVGNAGSWLITDILTPLILLICLPKLSRQSHYG